MQKKKMLEDRTDTEKLKELFKATHRIALEERDSAWDPEEIETLSKVLSLLPAAMVSKNGNLNAIVRQREYDGEYDQAPGHGMYRSVAGPEAKKDYIVMYDKALRDEAGNLKVGNIAKTLIHELAHSLDDENSKQFSEWIEISGWFKEDGEPWLPSREVGFLNQYSRKHPKEDFAESFTAYVLDPDRLKIVSPQKYMFMERFFREQ
jgi:predicted Zn-dependent protease with MMP-like domain